MINIRRTSEESASERSRTRRPASRWCSSAWRSNVGLPTVVLLVIVTMQTVELISTRNATLKLRSKKSHLSEDEPIASPPKSEKAVDAPVLHVATDEEVLSKRALKIAAHHKVSPIQSVPDFLQSGDNDSVFEMEREGSVSNASSQSTAPQKLELTLPKVDKIRIVESDGGLQGTFDEEEQLAREQAWEIKNAGWPDLSYDKCLGLLHDGSWETRVENYIRVPENSTFGVSMAGNSSLAWRGPGTCEYKIYDPSSVSTCLTKHYPVIQVLGDSRARQYWSAIKPLVEPDAEHFVMFDSAWQMPTENHLSLPEIGLEMDQAWVKKSAAITKSMRLRYKNHTRPNVLIVTAMILHPVTMSGMEKDPIWNERLTNTSYMEDEVRKTEDWMRTIVLGEMHYWAKRGTKVILLEAEPISPEVYPLDTKRNFYVAQHNELLKEIIPEHGIDGKIFRMSANTKVVKHPNGRYMLPDRFHLQKKDKPRVTPPTLLTNINIMMNFLCNRHQSKTEQESGLCCKEDR